MPRSSVDNREFEDEETAVLYKSEERPALPEPQDCNKDTSYSLPVSRQASTSKPNNVEVNRRNMMYTFVPNWPLDGPKLDALSILGHSKSDTIRIVQRAFPLLQTYPPDRIEFLTAMHIDSNNNALGNRLAAVMDEAWPAFLDCPPSRLWIRVPRTAEEEAAPKIVQPSSCLWQYMIAVLGLTLVSVIFCCLLARAIIWFFR